MTGFTVIGGYLGAGKTTLLNHLLAHAQGRRLGVLVNDFGAINIDADLVDSRSDARINLANGCICCTLADGFIEAIDQMQSISPPLDHIVVEASGVADVHQLAQYGHLPGLVLDAVLVVADAETLLQKAADRYVGETVRRQIAVADLVILNKTDLVGEPERKQVMDWLADAFPRTPVIPSVRGVVPADVLFGAGSEAVRPIVPVTPHADYVRWHVELPVPWERSQIETFCQGLDTAVIRAKGTVGYADGSGVQVQVVGRRAEISVLEGAPPGTRLVAIGLRGRLDPAVLDRLLRSVIPGGSVSSRC
jgi:G3E family GTPase